jgi:predicted acyltransferase (DUF342 family)
MDAWAPLGLVSVTAALLALPVSPALYELRKRVDVAPLPTSKHDGRIANFADAFYARVEPLRGQLLQLAARREIARVQVEGMDVLLIGCSEFDFESELLHGVSAVMCGSSLVVPSKRIINADVYTEANLEVGKDAAIRAGLAEGDLVLRDGSTALRWVHAYGVVELCKGSTSYGRLSALQEIRLDRGCSFQRVQAPRLLTRDRDRNRDLRPPVFAEARHFGEPPSSMPRIRIHGDFTVPAGHPMYANVIATGGLRFEQGACFVGSAKSYKNTIVEEGASIHGNLVCGGSVSLNSGCYVRGPIIAERDVIIGHEVCVGTIESPTTISCCNLRIGPGCQLHGTVWARVRAYVD